MTFNEKHHWVFPLVPTACACAKLDEYFGKIAECKNYGHAGAGRFRGPFGSEKGYQNQKSKIREQNGEIQSDFSDMGDTIQNTFAKMTHALSGCDGGQQ